MRSQIAFVICLLALAGCGGGGSGGSSTPPPVAPAPPPPPVVPAPPPVIGTNGGTVTENSGAKITFPAGAVSEDTTFRIAVDSTGAPPMPANLTRAGNTYAITPHGGNFERPVEVSIPVPNVALLNTQEFKLAKAEPNGEWQILDDSRVVDGKLTATVRGFSFFNVVVVTYILPIAQAVPYRREISFDCGPQNCHALVGPATVTMTVVGTGTQLPQPCVEGRLEVARNYSGGNGHDEVITMPLSGGSMTRTIPPSNGVLYPFYVNLMCNLAAGSPDFQFMGYLRADVIWETLPGETQYPLLSMRGMPTQVEVVEGHQTNIDAILMGGALRRYPSIRPSASDHAIVEWLRSDNDGVSWQVVGRSFQHEANTQPFGTGEMWAPWSVRHAFVATAADQGALIRVNACYTPPAPTVAPPCVASSPARINVLQVSSLPAITDPPRSVLIRTAQTANFSVNVSGAPAPTLQWQTRPANSTGEWTNVTLGSGATTANYTTPPRAPSDNGEQYRVVATNTLGSAASSPVTLSVSDLDVAPSITTQPASLNVTSGNDAVFAVVAHGTEALSYQWRFNGTNIAGANSPVLRLTGVSGANAGGYTVAVSNAAGNVSSNAAMLNVTAGTPAAVAPSIVTQPAAVTVNAGNTATFAVGVDGTGPFTFQWRRNDVNVTGANSASLTFNSVALPNAGSYSVVVTNSAGTATSNAVTLDVAPAAVAVAPTITSQPSTVIVPSGGSAILAVGATGSGPLSYQWSFNGSAIPGATSPVLALSNVSNGNVGNYTVSVANSVATVPSQAAQLILLGAPVITQEPEATTAVEGNTASFIVMASGSDLRYQWLRNGSQIPGATAALFTTPSLVTANSGAVYSVMIYNGAGMVTSQGAVLTVSSIIAPTVTQQPTNVSVQLGQAAQLCAAFGGTVPMVLHLQRWNGTAWVPFADIPTSSNEEVCYPWMEFRQSDSGTQFRFVAENAAGQIATDPMTFTVASPPAISTTTLVSVELDGGEPDYYSGMPSISADGRLVAFTSSGMNLIPGGTAAVNHAYVRDLSTGTTTLINRTTTGGESSRGVQNLQLASGGRYAVFTSFGNDMVANDTNAYLDVFRRDLLAGTTERVSVLSNGGQLENTGNGNFDARLAISGDGRYIAFMSPFDLGVGGDGSGDSGCYCLYLRDMQTGITRYIDGTPATSPIGYVAMSDDGRYLAYTVNTVSPNPQTIWVYDIQGGTREAAYTYGQDPYPTGQRQGLSISADGRYIAFAVNSPDLTGSTFDQVMVVDRNNPAVPTLVSTGTNGAGDGHSAYPKISGDGRYVLFETRALNLAAGLSPLNRYAMVRDLVSGTTTLASHELDGDPSGLGEYGTHAISRDGTIIAFATAQVFAEPRR